MIAYPVMDLIKAIHERRSIRTYKADPIPEEILIEVIEAVRRCPSWANTQTWRLIAVKDPAVKEALMETLTPTNPARKAFPQAPVVVCLVSLLGRSGFFKADPATDKGDWFMFDAGIAMEHLVLAAWSFGLGTCHVGAFDARKAEEVLGVPEGYALVEMSPLGYFEEPPPERPRKPLNEILFCDRFGKPYLP